jgi:N-acetylneuraminic acid mutarotase
MPRPRSEFAAAVIDDWIYVVGGFGGLAQVDCFHPATGTWATAPDLPVGVHHVGVASLDGKLYAAGGYTEGGPATAILWAYEPEAGKWAERAPMNTSRGALGLVALDGKLYAIGGATEQLGGPVTGAVEIYDPLTDTWEPGAEMPTPREHLAVAAGDGRIFAVGGRANGDEDDTLAAAAEAYDPATDSWETLPPLPTPRGGVSGAYTSDHMIAFGGERGTTTFDTVEAFDVDTGTWVELPPMPTPRHGAASAVIGDTIYAIGGSTQAGVVENTGATEALTLPRQGTPEP